MQLIAPLSHTPVNHEYPHLGFVPNFVATTGWELFSHWDGSWYRTIATSGYGYADAKYSNFAFFPLFPLITHGVMMLGLPFEVAGTLVNNLAFLGALSILYRWVQERHGISTARWATAVLAWCPFSLFGTVTYTEGLFLLCSTACLQAFDKHQHARAALWGAMATATRVTGVALVPAMLIAAWKERRPAIAYAAGLAAGAGLLIFSVYCAIRFGDPLAFLHAQRGWRTSLGFDWLGWLNIFVNGLTFGTEFIKVVMILGGGYLLWRLRDKISPVAVAYGFCALALILASGSLTSVDRYAYGIVSLAIALGMLLARHPRWGYATMGYFAILLVAFSIRFARWRWVA
jgi:Gpi18-like mannosyltransferase